jgi:hypothetical protein
LIIDFRAVAPVLTVEDVEATAAWYDSQLAFKAVIETDGSRATQALLWRDDVRILLVASRGRVKPQVAVLITVKGIREFYDAVREQTAIVRRLVRQADGTLEFELRDPNGYGLIFREDPEAA